MKLDSPYRAQELRPSVAPPRCQVLFARWGWLVVGLAVAAASALWGLVWRFGVALDVALFMPYRVRLSELLAVGSVALLVEGGRRIVRGPSSNAWSAFKQWGSSRSTYTFRERRFSFDD